MKFLVILKFELKNWLSNAPFYVYSAVFFLLALLTTAGAAGLFEAGSAGPGIANAPLRIFSFGLFFNKLLLFLIPAITGVSIYRDFSSNFHRILYAYPFEKRDYLPAKFAGGFLPVLFISLLTLLGLALGACLPGVDPDKTITPDAGIYVQVFALYWLPNLLIAGVLVFAIVLISRNIYAGFMSVLILLLLREAITRLAGGAHGSWAGMLADPFGESAVLFFTRDWTAAESDRLPVPIEPVMIYNRLIWLALSIAVFIAAYRRFSFRQEPVTGRGRRSAVQPLPVSGPAGLTPAGLPRVQPDCSFGRQVRTVWHLAGADFRYILNSGVFLSVLAASAFFITVLLLNINPQTDTKILPVTWVVLGIPMLFFSLLILALTFLYAGMLVHRSRAAGIQGLIDATPTADWVFFTAKWLALIKMQLTLLALPMVVGMAIQGYQGYYHFEPGHYLFDLYTIHLSGFIVWALAALFVQTIFTNPYLGLGLLLFGALGIEMLPSAGITSPVFRFNQTPEPDFFLQYSDMNGHAHGLAAHFLYKFYWALFGLVLGCTGLLFWQRGEARRFGERAHLAKSKFKGNLAYVTTALIVAFTALGLFLLREEKRPVNKQFSAAEEKRYLDQFRKVFGNYRHTPQPRIVALSFQMDIYPETRAFRLNGRYTLVNKTAHPLDTLLIKSGYDEITGLELPPNTVNIASDTVLKFFVYKLETALLPGDSMFLPFTIQNKANTLLLRNSGVLENGTHIKNDIFPRLGYFAGAATPADTAEFSNHYQSIDADLIALDARISTALPQTAIAPGTLKKEWIQDGRRYFHYQTGRDIKFVFSLLSGKYALLQEKYKGVDLRIYHHPRHTYCLPQMMAGLRAALDYNTGFFSPYQHTQAQIIEFPRSEGTYATTAANCIPVSEIRFINDAQSAANGAVDISFYVAAHELSHQWWGNQVIPADAPGAVMLTESIAEYITAKICERQFGKKSALHFLGIQMDRYLAGRAAALQEEQPLARVSPDQQYIAYGKGAIAFYLLSERMGEERLNAVLRSFLEQHKQQGPPYATAAELLHALKVAAPDTLRPVIAQLFETTDIETFQRLLEEAGWKKIIVSGH